MCYKARFLGTILLAIGISLIVSCFFETITLRIALGVLAVCGGFVLLRN